MSRVIVVCNQKGGVGKTTTTVQIARAAVLRGLRVLAIDCDPQGNLTKSLAAEGSVETGQVGLADVLSARTPERIPDVVVDGVWDGLDVVPTMSSAEDPLSAVRDELVVAGAGRELRLKDAVAEVSSDYDVVFVDCAPSLDQLTINAFSAATDILVVTEAGLYATDGLAKLLSTIELVQRSYNPGLRIAGVVMNMFQARTVGGRTWLAEVKAGIEERGLRLFEPYIPNRVAIREATEGAMGLDQVNSAEARGFGELYMAVWDQVWEAGQ